VQSGGPISFSSRAGPRALARSHPCLRSPRATDRPTPPISDTTARYCAGPPVSSLSLSRSVSDRTCARGARRPPAPCVGCCQRRPPVGTRPHELPRAAWHPHARDPLSPPLFPLPVALPPSVFRRTLLRRKPDFSPLTDHSLERSSLPATPCTRTTASGHRSPPLPSEFLPTSAVVRLSPVSSSPSFQSPGFLSISSTPRLSRAAGPPQPRR
jgi:hypothetical protein